MADDVFSLAERLRRRRIALEQGDPTGGEAVDEIRDEGTRRVAEQVREELAPNSEAAAETSRAQEEKRTR